MSKLTVLGLSSHAAGPPDPFRAGGRRESHPPRRRPVATDVPAFGNRPRCLPLAVAAVAVNVAFGVEPAAAQMIPVTMAEDWLTVNDASASEGDSMTFTVTLDPAATVLSGFTVKPSFADGTATGTDYTANTAGIEFAGSRNETHTFTVATTKDEAAEADETFTVSLTIEADVVDNGRLKTVRVLQADTGTGTIVDDDSPTPALTIADASAAEGDSMTFTVTLDAAVSGGLTVTPSFTDGMAKKGADYTENTAALTFAGTAGETRSFTVETTEDTDVETDETFTVGLAVSGTSATVTATDTATGTITDDDDPTTVPVGPPSVTIFDASAEEGDGITFTVAMDGMALGGLTVTPSFTDGTAEKGVDYTANTAALTFTGMTGETKSFTVTTTEDEVVEAGETFTVGLTVSGTSTTVLATDTATGTITNDDTATVRLLDLTGREGNPSEVEKGMHYTPLTLFVVVDNPVQDDVKIFARVTGGTATKGTDYFAHQVSFNMGRGARRSQIGHFLKIIEDDVAEGDETVEITLRNYPNHPLPDGVTIVSAATGTIVDDDTAQLTIADASADEGDAITFAVTLDNAVEGGLSVTPSFTDGTATKGADYTENTAALLFAGNAGETRSFTVATTEDADGETGETFTVSLAVSGTSATVTATDTATGTINDKDSQARRVAAAVTVADTRADEGESMTFTVTLDKAVAGGLTVTPSFTDDTATKGADYTENTAALLFAGNAGETRSFTVATTEDTDVENDETFTVSLAVSGTAATVIATDSATGTITNDDRRDTSRVVAAAVTVADTRADEGDSMTFEVTLDRAVSGGLTVTPSFTDGTATKGADYTENTAALLFAGNAGETRSFTVATTEDTDVENDETFTVSLAVSGTSATVTATDSATGTITDDDRRDTSRVAAAVTVADAWADEGDSMTFEVRLSRSVAGGLTVRPRFTDGTATGGVDYTGNTRGIGFAGNAGETKRFTVATTEDTDEEPDETFTVSLTVSGTSATVTATDTATGTIVDDDKATGTIAETAALTVADASATEGDGITFTVRPGRRGARGPDGDAGLHRRHGDAGRGLHREHGRARLRGRGRRDADLHGGDDRRCRGRAGRDVHGEPGRLGDLGDGDGRGHGDGDDRRRR